MKVAFSKRGVLLAAGLLGLAFHAGAQAAPWEQAPINSSDQASLQQGARTFATWWHGCRDACQSRGKRP